jgi:hypothetical protein
MTSERTWRTSTYTGGNGGNCVEVADGNRTVDVRDTKDRGGLVLSVNAEAWRTFTESLKK